MLDRLQQLDRLWHTIRYLKPSQFYHRLKRLQRAYLLRQDAYPLPAPEQFSPCVASPLPFDAADIPPEAERLASGLFDFIGLPLVEMEQTEWHQAPHDDLLWLFNLHYFEWGIELARAWRASGDERFAQRVIELMLDWVEHNPFPQGPGWHPYPTSRRLVSWAVILGALGDYEPDQEGLRPSKLLASIDQQASYLADWPEKELEGNHLLANYHALAWIEVQLGEQLRVETRSKIAPFIEEFWREFLEQTRPDGSHEEQSVSYQMVVLKDAFELMLLALAARRTVADAVRERIEKMFEWLVSVMLPDGKGDFHAPLLNDSVRGYPIEARHLISVGAAYFARPDWKVVAGDASHDEIRWWLGDEMLKAYLAMPAKPPENTSFGHRDSGYFVIRSSWEPDADYVLFDCGPIGPDHIPGHAHADTLNVVVAVGGVPLVVDPGVFEYRAGRWRDHFRSTRAHNTVTVDGADQSEVWSSFRVARRARATVERWERGRCVEGSHDGYRRLDGDVVHRRCVEYQAPGRWKLVDTLLVQQGSHRYEVTFQLSARVRVVVIEKQRAIVTLDTGNEVSFEFESSADLVLSKETGWVSEKWNQKQDAPRLVASTTSEDSEVRIQTAITSGVGSMK